MKTLKGLVAVAAVAASATAFAAPYYESYDGKQYVSEGHVYNFGFDMWYDNSLYGVGTNSSLNLTNDAVGAFGAWESAQLTIRLSDMDFWESDVTTIKLAAYNNRTGATLFDVGTFGWNGNYSNGFEWVLDHTFDDLQLAAMAEEGWGNIGIMATATHWSHFNDFFIEHVSLLVNTTEPTSVPEPGTLALFGLGLAGLGLARRKAKQ